MKKEEPKKDKKPRKTPKKSGSASSKSHKGKEDALFTENSELHSEEKLKPVSPVEESVISELNNSEIIPDTPVTDENTDEQNLQEITEIIREDVIPETTEAQIPQINEYTEQPAKELKEQSVEENIQPAEETYTSEIVHTKEVVQTAEETPPTDVVHYDEVQPVEETPPTDVVHYDEVQPVEKTPPTDVVHYDEVQPVEEIPPTDVVREEVVQTVDETQPDDVVREKVVQTVDETRPDENIQQEEKEAHETEKPETVFPKSNYQISLINENLLRIVVETDKPVGVDCFVKNRKPDDDDSTQTQSNRILVHPKETGKLQEVEIIVSIDKSEGVKIVETGKKYDEKTLQESTPESEEPKEKKPKKFLIDPSVADILQKPVSEEIWEKYKPMTREEYFEEKLKPSKNKYAINRALVEKHLKIGIVASVILLIFSMIVYSGVTSDNESGDEQKPQRLIVIQDLPEMKVDIPLEEKKDDGEDNKSDITPKINIRRNPIRTPRIEITKKDTTAKTDSTDIAKNNQELDKLRRGDTTGTGTSVSGINSTDTLNANAVSLPFRNYGWVLIDSLDYGGRKFKFSSDTSQVIKDPSEVGKVSDFKMFVIQDIKGTEFSCGKNLKDFPVLVTEYKAYKCEPREELLSNQIEYMYRIINKDNTYAITIKVEYKKEYKPEYYPKVDTLVSQIRLPQFLKTEN